MKKTQLELLEEAVALAKGNPGANIHILAASGETLQDFVWTAHEIDRVALGLWGVIAERIFTDTQEYAEAFEDEHEREPTQEEIDRVMSPAILIYTVGEDMTVKEAPDDPR